MSRSRGRRHVLVLFLPLVVAAAVAVAVVTRGGGVLAARTTADSAGGATTPAGGAGFAPYVDTSLYPPFNLVTTAERTGVKQFNLAFVVSGGSGGCTPEWGGVTAIGSDPVASQIGALRAIGGDVRISFGGEAGSELALTCTSVSQLAAAYQQVISAYGVSKIDFDIEGAAIENAAANTRRDQAIAALQAADPGLQMSFTLPVLPSGLTADGVAVLTGAVQAGVQIAAVNVMAMDYGDGAAPSPSGQLGTFAIDAATATDAQVASVARDQRRRRLVQDRGHPDDRRQRHQRRDLHPGQRAAARRLRRHQAPRLAVHVVGRPGPAVPRRCASQRPADLQQHHPVPGRVHDRTRRLLSALTPAERTPAMTCPAATMLAGSPRPCCRAAAGRAVHPRQRTYVGAPAGRAPGGRLRHRRDGRR